jgi:hypothetical protein
VYCRDWLLCSLVAFSNKPGFGEIPIRDPCRKCLTFDSVCMCVCHSIVYFPSEIPIYLPLCMCVCEREFVCKCSITVVMCVCGSVADVCVWLSRVISCALILCAFFDSPEPGSRRFDDSKQRKNERYELCRHCEDCIANVTVLWRNGARR